MPDDSRSQQHYSTCKGTLAVKRDPFTSPPPITIANCKQSYRLSIVRSKRRAAPSARHHPSRDLRSLPRWGEGPREIHVRARGHGKKEVVRGAEEKRRRKEWIDELEQRKLITCPVAFSWLDYLAERENKREKREKNARADWLQSREIIRRRDIRFCTTQWLREILTGYLIEQKRNALFIC